MTPEMQAWIWIHAWIVQEVGKVICKSGEVLLRVFSAD